MSANDTDRLDYLVMQSEELIKHLDENYKYQLPNPTTAMQEIMFQAGFRSLIDSLLYRLHRGYDNQLKLGE